MRLSKTMNLTEISRLISHQWPCREVQTRQLACLLSVSPRHLTLSRFHHHHNEQPPLTHPPNPAAPPQPINPRYPRHCRNLQNNHRARCALDAASPARHRPRHGMHHGAASPDQDPMDDAGGIGAEGGVGKFWKGAVRAC